MTTDNYFKEFKEALQQEINAIQNDNSAVFYLNNGKFLKSDDEFHFYSFITDSEVNFQDETPIELEYNRKKYKGFIVSLEGFDIIVRLEENIGNLVPSAVMTSDPSYLLQALIERLQDLQASNHLELSKALLQENNPPHNSSMMQPSKEPAFPEIPDIQLQCNEYQRNAISHVLREPISFIWGPPGTGKSRTLGWTARALLEQGESVLVVAHSNVAVDVAMMNIASCTENTKDYQQGKILRLGISMLDDVKKKYPNILALHVLRQQNPELVEEIEKLEQEKVSLHRRLETQLVQQIRILVTERIQQIQTKLRSNYVLIREKEKELARNASILGCTFSKAAITKEVFSRSFDAVLIDEASMAYIPHCIFVAGLATKRIAIFGDFRQLPPIAQSDSPLAIKWLQRDIFEQAGIIEKVDARQQDPRLVMLALQYRMHPEIAAIPNKLFYNGYLVNHPDTVEATAALGDITPAPGKQLVLYNLHPFKAKCWSDKESYSRFNVISALATVSVINEIYSNSKASLGIITPYRSQSRLINRMLKDLGMHDTRLHVATVHKFQGSESDIILFDFVEGEPKGSAGRLVLGDMKSIAMRLANVTISRAKGKFITFADMSYLSTRLGIEDSFKMLLNEISHNALKFELASVYGNTRKAAIIPGKAELYTNSIEAEKAFNSDIKNATNEIALYWPDAKERFSKYVFRDLCTSTISIYFSGKGAYRFACSRKININIAENLSAGIVGIDRNTMWLFPDPDDEKSIAFRIMMPKTISLIYSYLRLIPESERRQNLEDKISENENSWWECPKCGAPLIPRYGPYGAYLVCSKRCGGHRSMSQHDATMYAKKFKITCNKCGSEMVGRKGQNGVFLGCSEYPRCRNTISFRDLLG